MARVEAAFERILGFRVSGQSSPIDYQMKRTGESFVAPQELDAGGISTGGTEPGFSSNEHVPRKAIHEAGGVRSGLSHEVALRRVVIAAVGSLGQSSRIEKVIPHAVCSFAARPCGRSVRFERPGRFAYGRLQDPRRSDGANRSDGAIEWRLRGATLRRGSAPRGPDVQTVVVRRIRMGCAARWRGRDASGRAALCPGSSVVPSALVGGPGTAQARCGVLVGFVGWIQRAAGSQTRGRAGISASTDGSRAFPTADRLRRVDGFLVEPLQVESARWIESEQRSGTCVAMGGKALAG